MFVAALDLLFDRLKGQNFEFGTVGLLQISNREPVVRVDSEQPTASAARKRVNPTLRTLQVEAVSGSGQQHGSVFWKHGAAAKLSSLNPSDTIADQVPTVSVISLAQCMLSFQRPSRYRMVRYGWTPAPRLSTYPLAIIDLLSTGTTRHWDTWWALIYYMQVQITRRFTGWAAGNSRPDWLKVLSPSPTSN